MWVHQAASISEATADVYMLVIWLPSSVQNIHGGNEKLFLVEFVLSKAKKNSAPRLKTLQRNITKHITAYYSILTFSLLDVEN